MHFGRHSDAIDYRVRIIDIRKARDQIDKFLLLFNLNRSYHSQGADLTKKLSIVLSEENTWEIGKRKRAVQIAQYGNSGMRRKKLTEFPNKVSTRIYQERGLNASIADLA